MRPLFEAGQSLAAARRKLGETLEAAHVEAAETDARLLVEHALGLDRAALLRAGERALTKEEAQRLIVVALRRLRREPIAQILGCKEFWSLPLRVDRTTLIPRPETETVVELALALLRDRGLRRAIRIADLGTGSGAILLALLSELPDAFGIGIDRSVEALAVARANARACALGERSAFVCGDFAAALGEAAFDLVVSNPPYVRAADIARLPPEVRDHEPRLALDGGADGLDAYRALARDMTRVLAPDGIAVVEIGAGQSEGVTGVFARARLQRRGTPRDDLAGIPRALAFG